MTFVSLTPSGARLLIPHAVRPPSQRRISGSLYGGIIGHQVSLTNEEGCAEIFLGKVEDERPNVKAQKCPETGIWNG